MHVLIVLAHPEPSSFNAQMAALAAETLRDQGHTTEVSDLYAARFDPLEGPRHYAQRASTERFDAQDEQRNASDKRTLPPETRAEIEKLQRADLLILQYPMWWFTVPAMLKGWFDRVLVYGETYTSRMRYDMGRFRGRRAMLSVTLGGPEPTFAYNGRNGDIDLLLWPMAMSLYFVGYTVLPHFTAFGIEGGLKYSDPDEMIARLKRYKCKYSERLRILDGLRPLDFSGWADWDEEGRLKPGRPGYSPFMRPSP
jgi:NAD(P)H dehydrogenase (quinone)